MYFLPEVNGRLNTILKTAVPGLLGDRMVEKFLLINTKCLDIRAVYFIPLTMGLRTVLIVHKNPVFVNHAANSCIN